MKPKILFILHLPPPIHGAALMGEYIRLNKQVNSDFDCEFINLGTNRHIGGSGKLRFKKIIYFFQILYRVTKELSRKKYDLCYMSITSGGNGFYKDFLAVAVVKCFRKKIVFHFHNKGVAINSNNAFKRWLYRFTLGGKNTKIILLSQRLYQDIAMYVDKSKVYYCANGIPEENISTNGYNHGGKEPVRILFLSNMMVAKGAYVLLEACALLNKTHSPFECHFVGDWVDIQEEDFKKKIAENGLTARVFAHGKKFGEEKLSFYKKSDVFVLPTLNEAFPLVILEAMQFGLPVVASEEGGIPDIIVDQQTGYLTPKNNAAELAERLGRLINDPDLAKQMGAAGENRFNQEFTIRKFGERFAGIINTLANNPS